MPIKGLPYIKIPIPKYKVRKEANEIKKTN